jgi:CheY-like chemotaxis protein
MVHGFAKQSGGHVDIYSEVGHGTAVSLYLPDANAVPLMQLPKAPQDIAREAAGETVLVVEDDPSVREVTVDRLEHLGYRFIESQDAGSALAVLESGKSVDVLLTDVIMPGGMTGVELVEQVRREYPWIKLILTSGYSPDVSAMTPHVPWLRKPYTLSDLAHTLRDVLDAD